MTDTSNPRDSEWESYKHQCFARGECPFSGLPLTQLGAGAPGSLSCWVCDCFGFAPEEVGS